MADGRIRLDRLDVRGMSRRRQKVSGELRLAQAPRLAALLREAGGALSFELETFVDARDRPAAALRLHGSLPLSCDLCGEALARGIEERRRYYFVASAREAAAVPIDPEEEAEPLVAGRAFDLYALVEDEAILALPISPRHPHCRGPEIEGREGVGRSAGRPSPFAALALLRPRRS